MSSPRTVVVISVTKRNCHTLFLMRLSLQRHFSRLTKFAHVASRLCSHKQPGKAVFYTSINLCVRKHVCRSVVVGIIVVKSSNSLRINAQCPGRHIEDLWNRHNIAIYSTLSPLCLCGSVTASVRC